MGIIGAVTLLVILFGVSTGDFPGFSDGLRYGLFQVVAIITTTGYGTHDFDQWNHFGRGILFGQPLLNVDSLVRVAVGADDRVVEDGHGDGADERRRHVAQLERVLDVGQRRRGLVFGGFRAAPPREPRRRCCSPLARAL